ncbi:MAG: class I SAM-dependent methyltransferase [Pseudomonadales bacterium]|nr:class I SAM-dependent methyltransferase [Pseudomonadales bacterium]
MSANTDGKNFKRKHHKYRPKNGRSPQRAKRQETHFKSCTGDVVIERFPRDYDPTLRAWSAADELLLEKLTSDYLKQFQQAKIVVLNDTYGALAISLAEHAPICLSDSLIAQEALQHNIHLNREKAATNHIITGSILDSPPTGIDILVMQLPKNHHYLKFQLETLKPALQPNAIVVAGVMVKHFHLNVLQHFETIIGETHTSLAKKKARLIVSRNSSLNTQRTQKPLLEYANRYPLPSTNLALYTLPNVFSMDKPDIGTRALISYIPKDPSLKKVLDLGCGNGALGIKAALENPQAHIYFCDESRMAIASAQLSWKHSGLTNTADFILSDALTHAPKDLDLILCNPPFHQSNSVHTEIAERMFAQAAKHLTNDGYLLVVANRHLPYEKSLKKYFHKTEKIATNTKFTIYRASP